MEGISASGRLKTADVLKGVLILGVIFVHMFMLNEVDDTGRSTSLVLQPLYVGLIGFFVISGYFLPAGDYIRRIKKTLKAPDRPGRMLFDPSCRIVCLALGTRSTFYP